MNACVVVDPCDSVPMGATKHIQCMFVNHPSIYNSMHLNVLHTVLHACILVLTSIDLPWREVDGMLVRLTRNLKEVDALSARVLGRRLLRCISYDKC